jgi:hypothetical protein
MKKIVFLFVLLTGNVFAQEATGFERIADAGINPQRLDFVTSLSDRILKAQQGGGYYQLSEQEADVAMRSGLNEAVQKQAYSQLSRSFGEYTGLVFDELLVPVDGAFYEVYRFRGQFGANGSGIEIRAILNPEGKLAGFYYKPWKNQL